MIAPAAQAQNLAPNRTKALILFDDSSRNFDPLDAVRKSIEATGGRVRARIGLAALIADIEVDVIPDLLAMDGVDGVFETIVELSPLDDAETTAAITAWNFLSDPPESAVDEHSTESVIDAFPAPDLPENEAERRQVEAAYEAHMAQLASGCGSNGAGYYDTSLYLAGDIAVGVFYTHPTNGAWTPTLTASSFAAIVTALDKFIDFEPSGRIVFTYVSEVDALGNPLAKPTNERLYANDLRNIWCTDWAYLIEVRNDGTWPNANLNGPSLRIDLGWFPYDPVVIHETGHVFGAYDQYCPGFGPSPRFGYLWATHGNACGNDGTGYFAGAGEGLPDVMSGWDGCYGYNTIVGPYTAGQLGWYDHDADGIPDVMDTQPVIDAASVTHTAGNQPIYSGIAFDSPLLNEQPFHGSVSINRITGVQFAIAKTFDPCDVIPWQDATAADLVFDSVSEGFLFQTPALPNGTYQVRIRATNTAGNTTIIPYVDQLVIAGSPTTNTRPFGVLSVKPARAKVGTIVTATGSSSRDIETPPAQLNYRWDWGDGSPLMLTGTTPTASHTYTQAGTYTVKMFVKDLLGLTHTVSRTVEATSFDTSPIATFQATPENRHFTLGPSYPVMFNPAGTTDGEDAFASLQIQWSVDGNVIIPWSQPTNQFVAVPGKALMFPPPACVLGPVYPRSERRIVKMEVRDTAFNVSSTERAIWVVPYNHRPTVPIFNAITFVPNGTNWDATVHASDVDSLTTWDGILEYRWDFEGDGIWDTLFEPGATRTVPSGSKSKLRVEVQDRFQARTVATQNLVSQGWPCNLNFTQ